jgi:hypothetical protein
MDRPVASAEARDAYERIAGELASAVGATPAKVMGMPTLYLGGKAFAGLFGDAMVFKLEGEAHAAALALPVAALFDPSGMGRPMKAWVTVPLANESEWPRLASAGAGGIATAGSATGSRARTSRDRLGTEGE